MGNAGNITAAGIEHRYTRFLTGSKMHTMPPIWWLRGRRIGDIRGGFFGKP